MELREHQCPEPDRGAPGPNDPGRAPVGQQRDHVRLDELPPPLELRMELELGREVHQLARRPRRERQHRSRGCGPPNTRFHRLRGARLHGAELDEGREDPESRREMDPPNPGVDGRGSGRSVYDGWTSFDVPGATVGPPRPTPWAYRFFNGVRP